MKPTSKRIERRSARLAGLAVAVALLVSLGSADAGTLTFGCPDCPLRIPPVGTRGTTVSTLGVDAWGTIADLDVFIDLRHSFVGDLDIFLQGPDSTEVHLFDNLGLSGNDIADVTFDDEALSSIADGVPPFGPGSFRPAPGVLGDFDGLELHGDWTLRVVDRFVGDSGMLLDWSLIAVSVPEPSGLGLLLVFSALGLARRRRRGPRSHQRRPDI